MRSKAFSLATLACLGLLAANSCPPQTIQETKLLASDGAAPDYFGISVSVSGDVAVVGANSDSDNGHDSGSAYVYRFDGMNWVEEAKLLASDGWLYDYFGTSVSVSGDLAVVGAWKDDDSGSDSGSAYVYRSNGTNWVEEEKLLASDGALQDYFGESVSVSGDVAVVGAHQGDDNGYNSGSAYVYRFNGTNWVEEAKLLASDGSISDYFGRSVSVSGDVAVVGAHQDDDIGFSDLGSAYIYRFDGTNWVEEANLRASDGAPDDAFGYSVSVSGDVAVVGAFGDDDNGDTSGSAYVYRFDGTNWVEEAKLLASDGAAVDYFGRSVSVSGDVAVVGAHQDSDNGMSSGSAYMYRFNGTNWVEEAKLLASDGSISDYFGRSVSVSGDVAVVGAHQDDDNGSGSGSAYVFSNLDGTPACSDGLDNDSDGLADLDDPGCATALDTSEHSGLLACDDGTDNDGDGSTDYPDDPGCADSFDLSERSPDLVCDDGEDNDGDGSTDYPDDPGCADSIDLSERSPDLVCDDGQDNDGDGRIDFDPVTHADPGDQFTLPSGSGDPGCFNPSYFTESPKCQDGIHNDGDGRMDYDAGLSANGSADPAGPDSYCVGSPWVNIEAPPTCGLGVELALLLPPLMWMWRRRRA